MGQQLLDLLKCYFPALFYWQIAKLYTCPLLLKLLAKWPDPREFKRQHPATLEAILRTVRLQEPEQRDPLIKSIKDAPLYTKDVVILECNSLRARVIAQQLSTLEEAIVELDAKIAQIMATLQEAPLFRKVRGVEQR